LTNQLKYITVNVVRQENLDFMRVWTLDERQIHCSRFISECVYSVSKKYTSVFLSWNSYPSASQVIFSSYCNLAKLLNYRQLCIDFLKNFGA
jgi:hypothetical protein